ncbi:MAG TPA: glycosyltransferase family 1 protein [Candidatus Sulfotelmatobacter sp.]|nr:glycosyltransferase family 1 protein [Candidatus Sulfotelmatobacter sp.]
MKKIVIDARELNTGSGRYVNKLIEHLQKLDKTHKYFLLIKPEDMEGFKPTNPNFMPVSCPHKEFTVSEQTALARQIKSLKPDLVHFAFPQQPALYAGPTVTTIHDLTTLRFSNPDKNQAVFKTKQKIYQQLMKRVAKKSVRVIVPSEFVEEDLIDFSGIKKDKVVVTYEAADLIKDEPKVVSELNRRDFILYVGRSFPHKNLERLVKAFGEIQKKRPDLILVLAGKEDGNYKRLKQFVAKARVHNVFFTGFVNDSELKWLYENTRAYVFPSLSEGFGLPGLEAMAYGAPVVSSSATCLPEIYGGAAKYFDPYDVDDMKNALEDVLSSNTLRNELIKKGHQRVKKYSWIKMAKETMKVYEDVLGKR